MKEAGTNRSSVAERPDINRYHDYREFLRDWLAYKKEKEPGFNLRRLAKESKIALGYLPTVISGGRTLTPKALDKLARPLGLSDTERDHLELLVTVSDSASQDARVVALQKLQRSRSYRKLNPKEFEICEYLTKWYYIAIREMVTIEGFKLDPAWIVRRLRNKVSLLDIEEAIGFLKEKGFIEILESGSVRLTEKDIHCEGAVYRVALLQFHREMLSLASEAVNLPVEERTVMGHTLSIAAEDYVEVSKILNHALDQIAELEKKDKPKNVTFQVEVAAFPLTKNNEEGET